MSSDFDEISRKAATGELSPAEREWLEDHLRQNPAKRVELEWDRTFAEQLARKIEAMPAMPGWERAERAIAAGARPARASEPGLLDRISIWFAESFGFNLNIQAIAASLILAQAGLIGVLAWQDRGPNYTDVRGGVTDTVPRGPLLRVSFRADIREAEMRQAIAAIGGEIVGGPGQLGVYLVRVRDLDLATARDRLNATGATELIEIYEPKR